VSVPNITIRARVIACIGRSRDGVTRREIADALGCTYDQVRIAVNYLQRSRCPAEAALYAKVGARPMTGHSPSNVGKLRAPEPAHRAALDLVRQGWPDRLILRECRWTEAQLAEALATAAGAYAAGLRAEMFAREPLGKWDDNHKIKFNRLRVAGATDEEIAAACRKTPEQVWRRRRFDAREDERRAASPKETADMRDWKPGVKPAARALESDAIAALFKAVERPGRSADIIPFRRQPPPSLAHGRTGEAAS
jgi:hypothetical protein